MKHIVGQSRIAQVPPQVSIQLVLVTANESAECLGLSAPKLDNEILVGAIAKGGQRVHECPDYGTPPFTARFVARDGKKGTITMSTESGGIVKCGGFQALGRLDTIDGS